MLKNDDRFALGTRKGLVWLDLQWFCRQEYPGAKDISAGKEYGCTAKCTSHNKLPPRGNPKHLAVLLAVQLLPLRTAGYRVKSFRGCGDDVETSLCLKELLEIDKPVNEAKCSHALVLESVEKDCKFFVTQHPARMYRTFKRVCVCVIYSYIYLSLAC